MFSPWRKKERSGGRTNDGSVRFTVAQKPFRQALDLETGLGKFPLQSLIENPPSWSLRDRFRDRHRSLWRSSQLSVACGGRRQMRPDITVDSEIFIDGVSLPGNHVTPAPARNRLILDQPSLSRFAALRFCESDCGDFCGDSASRRACTHETRHR